MVDKNEGFHMLLRFVYSPEKAWSINIIVWKTFIAIILIMYFKSWGYQESAFFHHTV